jgi:maltokinase
LTLDLDQLPQLFAGIASWLPGQRWFGHKAEGVTFVRPRATLWVSPLPRPRALVLAEVGLESGAQAAYHLGLEFDPDSPPDSRDVIWDGVDLEGMRWSVREVLAQPSFSHALISAARSGAPQAARLVVTPEGADRILTSSAESRALGLEQSNSSLVFGERVLVKFYRRAWPAPSPEVELTSALTRVGFPAIAPALGAIELEVGGERTTLGLIQRYLANSTEGMVLALTSLRDLEGDLLMDADGEVPPPERCRRAVLEQGGSFLPSARELGHLTAALHLALASPASDLEPPVAPMGRSDLQSIRDRGLQHLERLLGVPEPRLEPLRVRAADARQLLVSVGRLTDAGSKIRVHGDLHLGQVVRNDEGWHFLDFEGRPSEPPELRRQSASPLRDVAGMLRSLEYAAALALRQQVHPDEANARTLSPYGRAWAEVMREAFWLAYWRDPGVLTLLPPAPGDRELLLRALELNQCLYELDYELNFRPDWIEIPLEGIVRLVAEGSQ